MSDDRSFLILFATETGNAQDAADRIARECRRISVEARVQSMDAYPLEDLVAEPVVIFVVATTGAGAEPRAMTPLWQMLLRVDLPPDLFEDTSVGVFGLGDSAYAKFCWAAKKLDRRLAALGALPLCPRGEGDEQHRAGIDGALDPWIAHLLDSLLLHYPLPEGSDILPADTLPPPRVTLLEAEPKKAPDDPLARDSAFHVATVSCNKRITKNGWFQDVRHIELDITDNIVYSPGDVAVIHPEAAPTDVEVFCNEMGWANMADTPYIITHTMADQSLPDHLPHVATLRTLFTRYLDFDAVPRRSFFRLIRHFTAEMLEREKLDEFVSEEGADDLYEYCHRVRRTIREVLSEFRSVKIPHEYVFDVFPPLRPRQFSIANSMKTSPHQVHLCVAIVRYRTRLKIPRRGVCTTFLAALQPGDQLRISIREGFFKLPPDSATPVICVGPGTGVAPMRALLAERIHAGATENSLYFGCRSAAQDEHYAEEWAAYGARGVLRYRVAHSRDGPEGVARTYVQNLLRADARTIGALVVRGAWVYISGSANQMPVAVRAALVDAVAEHDGRTAEEARSYVSAMERAGRLVEESWS